MPTPDLVSAPLPEREALITPLITAYPPDEKVPLEIVPVPRVRNETISVRDPRLRLPPLMVI